MALGPVSLAVRFKFQPAEMIDQLHILCGSGASVARSEAQTLNCRDDRSAPALSGSVAGVAHNGARTLSYVEGLKLPAHLR